MPRPRFSIIVAVFNGAATLERCLDSVACQTYPDKELIVLDGGSTDGSVALLEKNAEKIAYWESEPDRGIYHAWNKGLARATGDWICFLGSDDFFWAADVLERLTPHLQAALPDTRVVYGRIAVVSKSGALLREEGRDWAELRETFTGAMNLPHPGLMHHRALFAEHGPFDESLRISGDYDLLLRELPAREARFVPDLVTVGVQHGGLSYSPSAMSLMLEERERIHAKHGLTGRVGTPRVVRKMRLCAFLARLLGERGFRFAADAFRRMTGRKAAWQ